MAAGAMLTPPDYGARAYQNCDPAANPSSFRVCTACTRTSTSTRSSHVLVQLLNPHSVDSEYGLLLPTVFRSRRNSCINRSSYNDTTATRACPAYPVAGS